MAWSCLFFSLYSMRRGSFQFDIWVYCCGGMFAIFCFEMLLLFVSLLNHHRMRFQVFRFFYGQANGISRVCLLLLLANIFIATFGQRKIFPCIWQMLQHNNLSLQCAHLHPYRTDTDPHIVCRTNTISTFQVAWWSSATNWESTEKKTKRFLNKSFLIVTALPFWLWFVVFVLFVFFCLHKAFISTGPLLLDYSYV